MQPIVDFDQKIYVIASQYVGLRPFLVANGFEQLADDAVFNRMAKHISLTDALSAKMINPIVFKRRLMAFLDSQTASVDIDLIDSQTVDQADICIEGVLPCPIKIPLLEAFSHWLKYYQQQTNQTIDYDLKAANLGLDSIVAKVNTGDINALPDMLMSAGFDLFFDKKLMGQYFDQDVFAIANDQMNTTFMNDQIDLRDPQKKYLITGVVPAVFLINHDALGDRPVPRTWQDLLSDTYIDSVAIPLGDLDLFNALVVTIYSSLGMAGIKQLARVYQKSLHPSEMVMQRRAAGSENPAISLLPYFFTQMIQQPYLSYVWPDDGAIISPIFMIAKREKLTQLQPIIDFFRSEQIGEVFSANGKFPSTNPAVSTGLTPEQTFKWVGWDFIHNTDIGELLREIERVFHGAVAGVHAADDMII